MLIVYPMLLFQSAARLPLQVMADIALTGLMVRYVRSNSSRVFPPIWDV
jgi:hypothetical protein